MSANTSPNMSMKVSQTPMIDKPSHFMMKKLAQPKTHVRITAYMLNTEGNLIPITLLAPSPTWNGGRPAASCAVGKNRCQTEVSAYNSNVQVLLEKHHQSSKNQTQEIRSGLGC